MGFYDSLKRVFGRGEKRVAAERRAATHMTRVMKASSVDSLSGSDPAWASSTSLGVDIVDRATATLWVYACVSLIARTLADIPIRVMVGDEEAPVDDPLVELLAHPAPKWSYTRFAQSAVWYMEMTGSAYIQKVRTATGRSAWEEAARWASDDPLSETPQALGAVDELWVYGADSYSTEINETRATRGGGFQRPTVDHYEDKDGKKQAPWDVIQVLHPAPGDGNEGEGLAPFEAAKKEVEVDLGAVTFQQNTFKNRAVPHGVWSIVEEVSDDQYEELEEHLRTKYEGAANAGRGMLLGAEVKYIQLAQNAVDLEYTNGRKLSREGICASFNVPPPLVGILDRATYSNMTQAELLLWKLKILPLLGMIVTGLNTELCPEFGPTHRVEPDLSGADALLPILAEKLKLAKELFAMGVPMQQINKKLHLGLDEYLGWEVGLVPGALVPVSMHSEAGGGDER